MQNMETQNKHDFKIKFEKTEHAINVDTYIQSLSALSVLLKEVNYQVDNSNPEVTINVVAEESGSFDVLLQIAEFVHDNHTIIRENVETLSWVVAIAVGVIQHEGEQDAAGGGVELRQAEIHQVRPGVQHADPKVHGLRPLIEGAEQRERDAAGRGEDGPGVGGAAGEEPEDERRGQGDAHQRIEDIEDRKSVV